ncbi:putative low-specificity L-threonine aldolase 2 [Bulinus truncatus]|nr:putative low-specificity L-threonine aldolase 2 [Bulinus truncatus]
MNILRHFSLEKPITAFSLKRNYSSVGSCVIDLRSDTVTKPTARMREAMKNAEVGDDVYEEDPTVNKICASLLGKEASLLLPTNTMANLASVIVHCSGRFNEVIVGEDSHMYMYEVAGLAQLGGIQARSVANLSNGTLDVKEIQSKVRPLNDVHQPWTKVICLENTQNRCGGKVLSVEYIKQVQKLAKDHGVILHLDGARLFNAAASLKVQAKDFAQHVDSVTIAFSKGLCCPIGSVMAGTKDFISMAKKTRKALGGGMRQAGVIAAPMLVALEEILPKLDEDHVKAHRIAQAITDLKYNTVCSVNMEGVQSNIVMIDVLDRVGPSQFVNRMKHVTEKEKKSLGQSISILMTSFYGSKVRYVTHHDVTHEDVDKVITKLKFVIEELSS